MSCFNCFPKRDIVPVPVLSLFFTPDFNISDTHLNRVFNQWCDLGIFKQVFNTFLKSAQTGTIQSSALVFNGPDAFNIGFNPRDHISYVWKELDYGTKVEIICQKSNGKGHVPYDKNIKEHFGGIGIWKPN